MRYKEIGKQKKKKENKLSWKRMKKPTEKTILPKTELQKKINHMELCNSFNTEYS
jgi:hypothetical protein